LDYWSESYQPPSNKYISILFYFAGFTADYLFNTACRLGKMLLKRLRGSIEKQAVCNQTLKIIGQYFLNSYRYDWFLLLWAIVVSFLTEPELSVELLSPTPRQ